jgi:cyclopropane-fatty-acyl-phospholipid synthase
MDRLLHFLLKTFIRRGRFRVTTSRGTVFTFGDGTGRPVSVRFASRDAEWGILLDPELKFGESYMDGTFVVEEGTIADVLAITCGQGSEVPYWARPQALLRYLRRRLSQFNPRPRSRRNVAHHYDLDGRLYSLFLDADRQYSCAYFENPDQSLDDAQLAKKRHLAAKLLIEPDSGVLDIGCGWGGLACHAAQHFGATVHGVTLSEAQLEAARARAAERGLTDRVTFELRDYRTLETSGQFDAIAQIGMFEHVGLANHDAFFAQVHGLLALGGLYLHQAITRRASRDLARFHKRTAYMEVINKWIFPGGELDYIGLTLTNMERAGFEVRDVESTREHYYLALKAWSERLWARRAEAVAEAGEARTRLWLLYFALSAMGFWRGPICDFQTLAQKKMTGPSGLPLRRG